MVRKCAVRMCPNYKDEGVTFHYFPKDKKLSEIWAKKCQRLDLLDLDSKERSGFGVCWLHFKRDDYSASSSDKTKRQRLKARVVPSLYLCANSLSTNRNRTVDLESKNSTSIPCAKFSPKNLYSTCGITDEERCITSVLSHKHLDVQPSVTKVQSNDKSAARNVNRQSDRHSSLQGKSFLPAQSNHFEQENELPVGTILDEYSNPHWQPKKKSIICSEHFEAECFKIQRNGSRRLLEGSLPTILPPENPQCLRKPVPVKQHASTFHDLPLNEEPQLAVEPESFSTSPTMIQSSISSGDSGPAAKKAKLDATPQPEGRSSDGGKCFICDSAMVGKKYSLASCMTNGTKVRLVEVLGRLVCDNYMVVVSHGDFICRGCANLLNTLDRLDAEITSVKRIVLNFVERKYRLGDRLQAQLTPTPVIYSKTATAAPLTQTTLMSNKKVAASPAPQTPQSSKQVALPGRAKKATPTKQATSPLSTKQATTPLSTKPTAVAAPAKTNTPVAAPAKTNTPVRTKSFKITLKDEQILGQSPKILQTAEDQVFNKISPGAGAQTNLPRNVWMQCNQCQYTTNQRSVMLEHLRQHVASRSGKDAAKTPASKATSSSDTTTTTTTTTTASTAADKTVEPTSSTTVSEKTDVAPSTSAEETPTTSTDKETPAEPKESEIPITITVDANAASSSVAPVKQTIVVRQTSEPAKSPGIVSKMLAGNKVVAIQNTAALASPKVKIITTSKTDTKSKVKVPATPQVFSSTSKKSQPDPSMPSLLGDDDS